MARLIGLPSSIRGIIFDMDKTLYTDNGYLSDGEEGEINALARALDTSFEAALERFTSTRQILSQVNNRKVARNEVITHMGFSRRWWNKIRETAYRPEDFIGSNEELCRRVAQLARCYRLAVVSNSPTSIVKRVLSKIGLDSIPNLLVLGTNDGLPKPSTQLFEKACSRLGVSPSECLSIGDRFDVDALPALRLGMGAIVVDDMGDLLNLLSGLIRGKNRAPAKVYDLQRSLRLYRQGETVVVAYTGQAGAGKTTVAQACHQLAVAMDVPSALLPLDAFFILSSRERKLWLEEGKRIGGSEWEYRRNQMSWWNLDGLQGALSSLKRKESLNLSGVYNRADKGELTGSLEIPVDVDKGLLLFVEGVAVAHLADNYEELVYLHVNPDTRRERLLGRDADRRGDDKAAKERFQLTEDFERPYFSDNLNKATLFVDNSGVPKIMDSPPALAEL